MSGQLRLTRNGFDGPGRSGSQDGAAAVLVLLAAGMAGEREDLRQAGRQAGRLLDADAGLLRCWRFSRARGCPCLSGRRGVQRHVEEDGGVETVETVGKRGGGGGETAEEKAALSW